jgi:hypothetical protein
LSDLLETEDTRLLTEIGFIALSAGLEGQADLIFRGIEAARPGQEAGPLGRALVHMARNELDGAIAILRALPPSDAALSYLGLALARRGDGAEARSILQRVVRTASDDAFVNLANAALQALPD